VLLSRRKSLPFSHWLIPKSCDGPHKKVARATRGPSIAGCRPLSKRTFQRNEISYTKIVTYEPIIVIALFTYLRILVIARQIKPELVLKLKWVQRLERSGRSSSKWRHLVNDKIKHCETSASHCVSCINRQRMEYLTRGESLAMTLPFSSHIS
jgi:hypothetical protein